MMISTFRILILASVLPGATLGPKYDIYKQVGGVEKVVDTKHAVWFNTRADWTREVYKACRAHKLSKQGAILAVAHARLAAGHWLAPKKCKGPLYGWNQWGMVAGTYWKTHGGRYYHQGQDWQYYGSMEKGVAGFLHEAARRPPDTMMHELHDAHPNILAYTACLYGSNGCFKWKTCSKGKSAIGLCMQTTASQLQSITKKVQDDLEDQGFEF